MLRYKVKRLLVGVVVAACALVAATAAFGFSGPPVVNQQFRPAPEVQPATWCGQVDGMATDTVVEHFMQDASGNILDNVRFTSLFTATETRKSILSSASSTTKTSGPIDNDNGTVSFITKITGLVLKFQIPGGPVLKATDGEPLRSAGDLTLEDVFNATTGDYITTNISFTGPHLGAEGVDFCSPSVAYLLDQ